MNKLFSPEVLPIPPASLDEASLRRFHEGLFNYLRRLEVSLGKSFNENLGAGWVNLDFLIKVSGTGTMILDTRNWKGRAFLLLVKYSGADDWIGDTYPQQHVIDENPGADVVMTTYASSTVDVTVDSSTGYVLFNCTSYGGSQLYFRVTLWGTERKNSLRPDRWFGDNPHTTTVTTSP